MIFLKVKLCFLLVMCVVCIGIGRKPLVKRHSRLVWISGSLKLSSVLLNVNSRLNCLWGQVKLFIVVKLWRRVQIFQLLEVYLQILNAIRRTSKNYMAASIPETLLAFRTTWTNSSSLSNSVSFLKLPPAWGHSLLASLPTKGYQIKVLTYLSKYLATFWS